MKHLKWPEDNRICKLPDTNGVCPGCCSEVSPLLNYEVKWKCIWKKGHTQSHCDIWCVEWDDEGNIISTGYKDRCGYCGEEVPESGMTYCGKACAALGNIND